MSEAISSDVSIKTHRKPACAVELEVHAPPEIVEKARADAVKEVNKEVSFPGFRKGKAPADMILKKHPQAVEKAWHKAIASRAFSAIRLRSEVPRLRAGSSINFDLKNHSLADGADLLFFFETEPEIPSVDPLLFQEKPVERREVGDKEIDEAIRQMQFFYASWTPVHDREIREGDYLIIDLNTLDEPPLKIFNHIRFEVSKARMANWMQDLVIGAKAGDVLDGVSAPDESASEEEKKEFAPKKVRVTVHKVEEAVLPPADDEFARKVGSEDLAAMRSFIKALLEKNVDDQVRSKQREQVTEFLAAAYPFEIPLSLINTEVRYRKEQALKTKAYRDLSHEERKAYDEKLYQDASESLRLFYLSRRIVAEAKIPVTHDEVQRQAVQDAKAAGMDVAPDQLPKEQYALALSKLLLAKAQDYILEQSKKLDLPEGPKI